MQEETNNPILFMPVGSDGNPRHLPTLDTSRAIVNRASNLSCAPDLSFNSVNTDFLLGQKKKQWIWIDGIRPRWI